MELNIGKNLKRLRSTKGITQEQLSSVMNVSCASVSKWERGETYPDITLLQPLAFYFGVTVDELMGYDENKIQARIDEIILNYRNCRDADEAGKIIAEGGKISGFIDLGNAGVCDRYQDIALCLRSIEQNLSGKYRGGKNPIDYDPAKLFDKLGIMPDHEKIQYYLYLDMLF